MYLLSVRQSQMGRTLLSMRDAGLHSKELTCRVFFSLRRPPLLSPIAPLSGGFIHRSGPLFQQQKPLRASARA